MGKKEQAEKTREVGWGKGKGSNWIPRPQRTSQAHAFRGALEIACRAFAVFSLRKEPLQSLGIDKGKTLLLPSSVVVLGEPYGDIMGRELKQFPLQLEN